MVRTEKDTVVVFCLEVMFEGREACSKDRPRGVEA